MIQPLSPEVESKLLDLFPRLTLTEQHLSVALYRLLTEGQPVAREVLAARVGLAVAEVDAMLAGWFRWFGVFYDDADRIIGYWGLALSQTRHRFRVDGRLLYAWCAWDTLFIPPILGLTAEVESRCPVTGDAIRLTVGPQGVKSLEPEETVVSLVLPEESQVKEDVVLNFCHYVHFFRSAEAGEQWAHAHPGTFLVTVDEAWRLGQAKNAAQYPDLTEIAGSETSPC